MVQGLIWTDGVSMSYHLIAIFNFFFLSSIIQTQTRMYRCQLSALVKFCLIGDFFFFLFSFFSVPKSLQVQVMKLPKLHP